MLIRDALLAGKLARYVQNKGRSEPKPDGRFDFAENGRMQKSGLMENKK
jgi:hypothetical protein